MTASGLVDRVITRKDVLDVDGTVIGRNKNISDTPVEYHGSLIRDGNIYKAAIMKFTEVPLFSRGEVWVGKVNGVAITISSIEEAKRVKLELSLSEAKTKIEAYARDLKRRFSENADMEDLASWPELTSISKQVINGTAYPDDIEILQIECDKRGDGITVNILAESVLTKRKTYMKTLGAIKGVTANALRRISTAQSIEAIKIQMDELKTEAAFEITELTKYT